MSKQLPIGTRIKFTETLTENANEDHPGVIYAKKGDLGIITGHGTIEGYWCTWDDWPHEFGIGRKEFEVYK